MNTKEKNLANEQLTPALIKMRMKELDKKAADIERNTGINRATISQWVNGKTRPIGDAYRIMLKELKLTLDSEGNLVATDELTVIRTKSVPVLNYVQAGNFTTIEDVDALEKFEIPIDDIPNHNQYFLLKIKGDSMYNPSDRKSMNDGDIVLIDATIPPEIGNIVVAKNGEHEATIKKLAGDPAMPLLVPLNPQYQAIAAYNKDSKDYTLVGVATKVYSVRSIY